MDIIDSVKEIFNENIDNSDKIIDLIETQIVTKYLDKKNNAEVPTPKSIRINLLKIHNPFWESPRKTFEPSCGKGILIIEIIKKFMNGLKFKITDPNERYKFIVEECIYWADINEENINICKILIDPFNKYNLKYHIGNTLDLNITDKWNINSFDAVIGNPPFHKIVTDKKNISIWHLFVYKMFELLSYEGYLCFITPTGWRSPEGNYRKVYDLIKDHKLIYLNTNDLESGHRDFKVAICYDYYIVQNINDNSYKTEINDIKGNRFKINLNNWNFIPSGMFNIFEKLVATDNEETVQILQDYSSYDSRTLSKTQTDEYKYPISYTITKKKGMNKLYSKTYKNNHFVSKVIWSNGIGTYTIVDEEGYYGCSQFSYAIIDKIENLEKIKKCMDTDIFIDLMKYVKFTNDKYNFKTIGLFKKHFYDLI